VPLPPCSQIPALPSLHPSLAEKFSVVPTTLEKAALGGLSPEFTEKLGLPESAEAL